MQKSDMKKLWANSYLSGGNAAYLEELYELFLQDSSSVSAEWQHYFESLPKVNGYTSNDISPAAIQSQFLQLAKSPVKYAVTNTATTIEAKQLAVNELINAYRHYGHLIANINPLGGEMPTIPELTLEFHGLNSADTKGDFSAPLLFKDQKAKLADINTQLHTTYCGNIGFEFAYINNPQEKQWLIQRIESTQAQASLSPDIKRGLLKSLTMADGLEKYLHSRYVGQKRFSLEGGDSFIPMLHEASNCAAAQGVKQVVIGMAHRGRLNTLINVLGKAPQALFDEFEGKKDYGMTSGDVKYHLGFSSDINTPTGPLHLSLAFNPSHLEFIAAVVMGSTHARQEWHDEKMASAVMPVVVHGDAAFAGQGINMEVLNMSQTRAYKVGGVLHIIINNQVGFTTSNPHDMRSSTYCTDLAKMIEAPVFHVNGDDPEAVIFVTRLAVDYRHQFKKDVVIDLVCYRRLGHNEADEPSATQPAMYQKIRQHQTPREIYAQQLILEKICTQQDVDNLLAEYKANLDAGKPVVQILSDSLTAYHSKHWQAYADKSWREQANTGVSKDKLVQLAQRLETLPQGFTLQQQVGNVIAARRKMTKGELPLDWGYAETLAYATLLEQGYPVRMSGQDCERGTFAHRHAVLHDFQTAKTYTPLHHVSEQQAKFSIYNSLLAESGPVGFEYGYATTNAQTLVLWEAQFGDFANGAQVIIDQFISSGCQKWQSLCGLTLLLPHGYEGAGPEHSSARLERFLQLCAQENMQVCVPTTPAQIFHLLRRQVMRLYRKPLIIMTPKSLLRHKLAISTLDELAQGKFATVIAEIDAINSAEVRRVVLCSGKVYYDLLTQRRENKQTDIAIFRLEQLYPFPYDELMQELQLYKNAKEIVWCQEEPKNQGAWYITRHRLEKCLAKNQQLFYVGRSASAAPAAGYMALHIKQQKQLIDDALVQTAFVADDK